MKCTTVVVYNAVKYATVVLTCYQGIGPRQRQRHWIHWLVLLGISIEIALINDDQLRLSQNTFIKCMHHNIPLQYHAVKKRD